MRIKDIINYLEELAPVRFAEVYDNSGLQIGDINNEADNVLICLDVTRQLIEFAIEENVRFIISHHPLLFKGIKKVDYNTAEGKLVSALIRNGIDLYSIHTNFDLAGAGLNQILAEAIGLRNITPYRKDKIDPLYKIVVYLPCEDADKVRVAMCEAGAGWIGNYSDCTFSVKGEGTFRPLEGTNPYIGTKDRIEKVDEFRLETVASADRLQEVIEALLRVHPYEEAAYDIFKLELEGQSYGFGRIGYLENPETYEEVIDRIKNALYTDMLRVIGRPKDKIESIAVFCGSFDMELEGLKRNKPDILITGDIKYHAAMELAQEGYCVVDAGHYHTEKLFVPGMSKLLGERFPGMNIIEYIGEDVFRYE